MGSERERGSGERAVFIQLREPSAVRGRNASRELAALTTVHVADARVQSAGAVRAAASGRQVRATAHHGARARRRAARIGEPEPRRLWRAVGGAAIFRTCHGAGVALSISPAASQRRMTILRSVHLEPQTGTGFIVRAGELLTVTDPRGEQVSDLVSFAHDDPSEWLSSGRTIDYANTIYLTT